MKLINNKENGVTLKYLEIKLTNKTDINVVEIKIRMK
jgi:hypothetical protein